MAVATGMSNPAFTAAANMGLRTLPAQIAALALSPVILVSNLNEEVSVTRSNSGGSYTRVK